MSLLLRPYQTDSIQQVFAAWRNGARSVLLVCPTGSGKRYMALWLLQYAHENRRKVLFVGNRRLLINQAADDAERFDVPYGVIMADTMQGDHGSRNQIASLQTLESRCIYEKWSNFPTGHGLPEADLLVHDECFTAETMILTPTGPRRIDNVRCGDNVFTATGIGVVNGLFCKESRDIYTIGFTDGTEVTCTGNHPFFSDSGWVAARTLAPRSVAFSVQDVSDLWSAVHANKAERLHDAGSVVDRSELLLQVLLEEIQEPNEQQGVGGQDEGQAPGDQAQADQERRERAIAAIGAACSVARSRGGMGGGASNKNRTAFSESKGLQNRHSQCGDDDRDRAGRSLPPDTDSSRTGCKKNDLPGVTRVAYISRHERKSYRTVFNLSVSGHPSYFANGKLVHNCHSDTERFQKLAAFYPNAKILGLTATPLGPEGRALTRQPYDVLIEGVKNSELIAQGHLLPTRVFAPSEPALEGVKVVNKQEYNQSQLGRRIQECHVFGDVFKEWEPYQDRATVCFVPGVAFGNSLCEQFNRRLGNGTAHIITAKTKPAERERAYAAVKCGDARLLVSVDVLREGFDLPVLQCGIDLQPNQQLRTYWQKVGRIKRPHAGQQTATYLDFAGNYWRFPHPDEDPKWPQGGSEETSQEVIERKRKEQGEPQPIMCPKCLGEGTLVMTSSGWKEIENVEVGDMVVTHAGRFRPVTFTHARTADAVIASGTGHSHGIVTTDDHQFLGSDGWEPIGSAADWCSPAISLDLSPPACPVSLTPEMMRFIGCWLGDGWVSIGKRSTRAHAIRGEIGLCSAKTWPEMTRILHTIASAGLSKDPKCRVMPTSYRYQIYGVELSRWLVEHFGCLAHGKRLPAWVYGLPRSHRMHLLQGYLEADGHWAKWGWQTTSVSKRLALGIKMLAQSVGFGVRMYHRPPPRNQIEGRTCNTMPPWVLAIVNCTSIAGSKLSTDGGMFYGPVRSITHVGPRMVYDLTVEDDHSFIAEGIVVHNCSLVRTRGPVCPGCGHQAGEAIRRIRMADGKLVEVPAVARQAKQVSDAERLFSKWQSRLFGALRSGLSYAQCAHLFHKQTGRYPDVGWPGTFPKGSLEWKLKPVDQYTPGTLARDCRIQKEKLSDRG